jgi:hypothetical protein
VINPRQISVVFQGQLPTAQVEQQALGRAMAQLRKLLPGAPLMLGTWEGALPPAARAFDHVVQVADPGALSAFKHGAPSAMNNVNRQLAGSAAVLRDVDTAYVLKLRLDCEVKHAGFLDEYAHQGRNADGGERIAVPGFFTLDPRMFERMPFHISDWFAFGPADALRRLWSTAPMSVDAASHYERHVYAVHSNHFERRFRAKLAIEQHIACGYAKQLGYVTPAFHNDVRPEVLASHDRFVVRELLILDQARFGLACRKYGQVARSSLQYFNCLDFLDWYLLNAAADPGFVPEPSLMAAAQRRARAKSWMRAATVLTDPMMPLLRHPVIKACISRTLRSALRLA